MTKTKFNIELHNLPTFY